jgi:hypothetical protein
MLFEPSDQVNSATPPNFNPQLQRFERAPSGKQRLGWFTVMCLILNRSIGSILPEFCKRERRNF